MKKITDFIVRRRNIIMVVFIFFAIVSVFLSQQVKINYEMTEYLPSDSETKIGMDIMEKEFDEEKESYLNIMFKNLTEEEKDDMYKKILEIDGVSSVDYEKESEKYNSNEYTLYVINVDDTDDSKTAATVYDTVNNEFKDYEFYTSGSIKDRNMTILPTWILVLAVAIVAIILIIMCESYIEPFLFLVCIGIAVLLNNGTNIIFGTVSNITSSISAILQLALSMDYSIMLINRYRQEKEKNNNNVEAMKEALYKSFSSIFSSSLTTIVGLITLVFMSFTIGKDLGLVLAKGVLLSLLVIFTCLPALILIFDKLITKTKKKAPKITLNHLGNFIYKFRSIGFILLIILFLGSYILKGNLKILYTPSDEDKIAEVFTENNQMAIVYNNKDEEKVSKYLKELEDTEKVDEVLAYGNTIGEKLKYDEFNDKLEELNTDTKIDDYLLKILYYNYYNDNKDKTMTFNEFIKFTEDNVLNNKNLSSKIDNNTKNNIERLKKFTSTSEMNKKRTYSEIANILEIDKNDAYNLFIYYYSNKVNIKLPIKDFVNFINKDVLTNENYSSNIPKSAKDSLTTLNKFLNKNTITKSMNSTEMANLFEIDKNTVDKLYLYYYSIYGVDNKLSINEFSNFVVNNVLTNKDYSNKFDSNTITNLKLLQTMSNKNIIEKNMNSKELSSLFGIDENLVKQLLLLKYTTIDSGTTLKISEFIDFVNYLKNNTNYLDSVDISAINKVSVFAKNENNINTTKINKERLSYIFNNISKGLVDTVYKTLQLPDNYQMTPQEFINLMVDNLSNNLDKTSLSNIKLIKIIIDDSLNPSKYTATQISKIFNINTKQTYQIYGLYNYTKGNTKNWKQTPYQFVKFILDNSSNEQISSNMNKENLNKLQMAYKIMNSTENNKEYSYKELSNLVGIDTNQTKMIYTLYSLQTTKLKITPINFVDFILQHKEDSELKGSIKADTVSNLKLIDKVMESVINNKKYSDNEISNLLGLENDDVKLLYSLYSAKNIDSNMSSSLKDFVEFMLNDVVKNEKYSNKISNEQTLKLNTINGIMNSVINKTEYNAEEIFGIISNLTNSMDKDTIDILYIYYGSEKYYQNNWAISIEDFINYVNDEVFTDSRFNDFIDNNMREKVEQAKNIIQDNKEKLIGSNYSRVIINTKFDLESDEVYEFIQKIYDNLEGTESYIIGDSLMSYEMSKTFENEFNYISILTMVTIFIVVAFTFKSFTTPLVLVLIIQCAVYMTMGILGMIGEHVYFIALLVVQSILMGATIDYAIVYTSYYIESREKLNVKESVKNAYNKSIHTILTSSSILIIATLLVGKFSSGIVSMLCNTLSQGVLCATVLILIILPATIACLDKFVVKRKNKQ